MAIPSVTAVTICGAFVVGLILVLLENIRPVLAKRLAVGDGQIDWILSSLNLSFIPMMLFSGMLIDQAGVKLIFLVSSVTTALALFWLSRGETPAAALGAIVLGGAGAAGLSTASTVLMRDAFFGDGYEAASQNLGNVFFAMGALVTPPVAGRLLQTAGYRRGLSVLAIVSLLPALVGALTERSAFSAAGSPGSWRHIFGEPAFWLAGVMLFLYAPLEGSLGTWAARYLSDRGVRQGLVEWLLVGFWLMFLAGRLGAAFLLQWRGFRSGGAEAGFIVVLALISGVALGNLAGSRSKLSAALGLLLVGAFFGPIFPTLVGFLLDWFPTARGTAYGGMFAIGATGNLLLLPLIGGYVRKNTVQRAMLIPMVMALALALLGLVLGLGWGSGR
jgi:MFS family permease